MRKSNMFSVVAGPVSFLSPRPERWRQPTGALRPEANRKPQTSLNKDGGEAMEGVVLLDGAD